MDQRIRDIGTWMIIYIWTIIHSKDCYEAFITNHDLHDWAVSTLKYPIMLYFVCKNICNCIYVCFGNVLPFRIGPWVAHWFLCVCVDQDGRRTANFEFVDLV